MRRYLALAYIPGGPRLLAGSLLVAPGQAAVDLVILLALHHSSGSFGLGGVAVAAGTLAFSISTIVQGRLVDRVGIRRVLMPAALALTVATAALATAVALGGPPALLIGLTALLGLSQPATGPAARAAWSSAAPDADTRTTAFSYCSVTQDIGFVAGPALFGLLATAATPAISLAGCGTLIAGGALAISSAAAAKAPAGRAMRTGTRDLLRSAAPLAAVMVAVGAALGAVDVAGPAFATQHGQPGLAGVLIAACSLGSLLGGLAYGARSWSLPVVHRLVACSGLLAALLVLPALASGPAAAAVGLVIAGAPMGAALTTAYLLADDLVPKGSTTVGFSLLTLALNAGAATGYALGGQLAAHGSAANGFLLGAGSALLAALGAATLAVAGRRIGHAKLPTR
ncbi:MAG TPA: MFS transporter [Solirubrobacteraceae bacterium]|nr:MFS transporter [Solirubrobacteraceae bacterium]